MAGFEREGYYSPKVKKKNLNKQDLQRESNLKMAKAHKPFFDRSLEWLATKLNPYRVWFTIGGGW